MKINTIFFIHGQVVGPEGAQWAGGYKKENFCLRILISWAQIDPWGLIRRTNTIKSVSETLLVIEILV